MGKKQTSTFIKRFDDSSLGNSILAIGTAQIEVEAEDQALSAVVMGSYGIDSVILTEHQNLQSLIDNFEESDDSKWLYGHGKKALYEHLSMKLKKENKYFNKNPKKMKTSNQRWLDFCDDCIILVALGSVLYDKHIELLHPKAYEKSIAINKDAWMNGADGKLPTLISEIETRSII
jgi:hypothetical protein